jgi:hypothetical protein
MPVTATLMGDPFPGRRDLVVQHKLGSPGPYDPMRATFMGIKIGLDRPRAAMASAHPTPATPFQAARPREVHIFAAAPGAASCCGNPVISLCSLPPPSSTS